MKRNWLSYIVVVIFTFFITGYVSAEEITTSYVNSMGVSMTDAEIDTLQNLGFLENEIETMTQEIFDENKNLDAELVSRNTNYYKTITYSPLSEEIKDGRNVLYYSEEISEYEYNHPESAIEPYYSSTTEIVNTEYKQMSASISKVGSNYRYKNSLTWKKEPKYRSYDIISIGHTEDVSVISTTRTFNMSYMADDEELGICYPTTYNIVSQWKSGPHGTAALIKLPDAPSYDMDMYLYFDVQKRTSDTIYVLDAYGNYRHAQMNVSVGTSFDFGVSSDGSISLGTSISPEVRQKYDSMSTSHATYSGIAW